MSTQLALALFAEYTAADRKVEEAPASLGFLRNNALIQIVDLSLAGRRLIDVAYFLVAEDSTVQREYQVDLGMFRWLLGTSSRNLRHLAKIIREAQKAAIELNEIYLDDPAADFYGSVPLLGAAIVRNGTFRFEVSERLQRAIKNPKTSHFFSLRVVFTSIHSRILYDRLQEHLESGVTPWFELPELRKWLQCEKATYDMFKHFRNKVLEPAIKEIKEKARLNVELQTMNVPGSKRIGQVRFKLLKDESSANNEQKLEFIILRNLYETLSRDFALNQAEFSEITANRELYTDERIQQAIDYTRHNIELGKVKHRAGGYLMKALREGYVLGTLDRQIHSRLAVSKKASQQDDNDSPHKAQTDAAAEERNGRLSALGWDGYDKLAPAEQALVMSDFCKSPTARPLAKMLEIELSALREHLSDTRVRLSFGIFVAGRLHRAAKAAHKDAA